MLVPLLALVAVAAITGTALWIYHVVKRDGPLWNPADGIPSRPSRIASEHPEGASR